MNWIKEILKSTASSEAPERYFWWAAVSAISAVTRRRIFLERWHYKLYPNLYVILVGPSGLRKSIPISLAQKLVERVDCTRVFSGRASIQAIIRELGKAYTLENKQIITDSIGFLLAPELDNLLVEDDHAPNLLLDLYDTFTKDKWKNILKSTSTDNLKNVYLTMFGASNETNLSLALPKSTTQGGLLARMSIVLEERKRLLNPLVRRPQFIPDYEELSKRLFEVSNLQGEFRWDNSVGEHYENWYNSFMTLESLEKTGTLDRLGDTVLKVAMCISLSYKNDLVFLKDDIDEAIFRCQECQTGMRKVFLGSGEHSLARATAHVLRILITRPNHMISRGKLLTQLFGEADVVDLDRIIDTLVQAGAVECIKQGMEEMVYKMSDETVSKFGRFVEEEKEGK